MCICAGATLSCTSLHCRRAVWCLQIWAQSAWAHTVGSKEIRVCVVDSGARPTHEDLAANIAGGWNR